MVAVESVSKTFGAATAVAEVSFTVARGRFLTILGPSGSGKTTLLRMIAGFIEPTRGEIHINGRPVSAVPPHRRSIGMVFQRLALFPHLTAWDNVAYPLRMRGFDAAEIPDRVAAMFGIVQLKGFEQRRIQQLSGGQQQRVALARALIVEPETLLLDEPLSNLDANLREEMRFEVRRLHDAFRYTTVYVTHDQSEAMTTADLICVMNLGKIEQAASPQEIYDRPVSEFVARFIGMSNVFKGKTLDGSTVSLAGVPLRVAGETIKGGADTPVSIRQHQIELMAKEPADKANVIPAKVVRQVFLGSSRDYMVEIADGTQLRLVTSAAENIDPGSGVWLRLPADKCRALAR